MNERDVLSELESLGSEQTRRTYRRHGVGDKQFGVSYAHLGKLQRKLKTDHDLARKLWSSGIHDAQILATMIADPAQITGKEIDDWSRALSNSVLTDALASLVSKTRFAKERVERWTKAKDEWMVCAGWQILGSLAQRDPSLPDGFYLSYLEIIQTRIHASKNRVRHAMNGALIGIGCRNPTLEKTALEVASRIGKVQVDHGETACKTPDAATYIRKTLAHRQAKAAKA